MSLIRSHWHQKLNGLIDDPEWPLKACNPVWCERDPGQSSSRTSQSVEAISASDGAPDERTNAPSENLTEQLWIRMYHILLIHTAQHFWTVKQWSWTMWLVNEWQVTVNGNHLNIFVTPAYCFRYTVTSRCAENYPIKTVPTLQGQRFNSYFSFMPCAKWSFVTWRSLVLSVAVNELG